MQHSISCLHLLCLALFSCATFASESESETGSSASLTRRHGHNTHADLVRRGVLQRGDHITNVTKRYLGLDYSLELLWGDRTLGVEIDTGSSDLWVAHTNFTCLNARGKPVYQAYCGFGQYVSGGFGDGRITDENFNVGYGTGHVTGYVGYEDITIAGLGVTHQEVGIAYQGYWDGDNVTAGLLGLAYPSITDAWSGTDYKNDTAANFRQYNPWFFTAFKRGLVKPLFSMALQRSANNAYAGEIAFGGLPNVSFTHDFAAKPIKVLKGEQDGPHDTNAKDFYAFEIDGWVLEGEFVPPADDEKTLYIVDSGNSQYGVPNALAAKFAAKFSPPAYYSHEHYQYQVSCNATAPKIAVRIAGKDFPIDPRDSIEQAADGENQRQTKPCVTGFYGSGKRGAGNALGDPFLRNVVAVFDVGALELKFARHVY